MERLDLSWCGEVVGYLVGPERTGSHLRGRWIAAKSDLTGPFVEPVTRGYSRPWTKPERVDFELDGEPRVADVTDLANQRIWITLRTNTRIFPQ